MLLYRYRTVPERTGLKPRHQIAERRYIVYTLCIYLSDNTNQHLFPMQAESNTGTTGWTDLGSSSKRKKKGERVEVRGGIPGGRKKATEE